MGNTVRFELPRTKTELLEKALALMACGYFFLVLGMPVSTAAQEIGAVTACICLAACWALAPKDAFVRLFPWRWLFVALLAYFLLNCALSVDPKYSFRVFTHGLHRGFLLLFVGIELARRDKLLLFVPWAFAIMGFYEGLDGIWQYVTGKDLVFGTPIMAGRLTGSFSTYRVGNLMALALSVSLVLPWVLPASWSMPRRIFCLGVLLFPPLFLLVYSQTRSGYLCFGAALMGFFALYRGVSWRWLLPLCFLVLCAILFGGERISLEAALRDGRVKELWPFAWAVFSAYPVFGAGIAGYNKAFLGLGLTPQMHRMAIEHPHNIYLQLLAETGIIGFIFFCACMGLTMFWGWRVIRTAMVWGAHGVTDSSCRFTSIRAMAAASWAASFGYLIMGVSAHSLFRTWWLSLGMSLIGVMIGACCCLKKLMANAQK